jgi:hypothetical protein
MMRLSTNRLPSAPLTSSRGFAMIELPLAMGILALGVVYFGATAHFTNKVLHLRGGMALLGIIGALLSAGLLLYLTCYFAFYIAERLSRLLRGECYLLPIIAPLAMPVFLNTANRALIKPPFVDLSDGQKIAAFLAAGLAGFLALAVAITVIHLLWRGLVYILVAIRNCTDTPFTPPGE